jgi:hypothetical protein
MQQLMIGATGLVSVSSGVVIAYLASGRPVYTKALQIIGGILLLGGFALRV